MLKRIAIVFIVALSQLGHAMDIALDAPHLEQKTNAQGKQVKVAYVGDLFQLEVLVSGEGRDPGSIEVQGLNQLIVQGTSKSVNVAMINGQMKTEVSHIYDVLAEKKGIYTLGPAQVTKLGKKASSGQLIIQVQEAPSSNQPPAATTHRGQHAPREHRNAQLGEHKVLVRLVPSKKTVVIGEPIEVLLKVYTRGRIVNIGLTGNFSFEGFDTKEAPALPNATESVEGETYNVFINRYLLTPKKEGTYKIGPINVDYIVHEYPKRVRKRHGRSGNFFDQVFDDFLSVPRQVKYRSASNVLTLGVSELPPYQGYIDAVGSFEKVTAELDQQQVQVDEPVVLRLHVTGETDFDQLAQIRLNLPQRLKFYKSKSFTTKASEQSLSGSKVFEFIVQAKRAGSVDIPPQEFTFFDTNERMYKTLKSNGLQLHVLEGEGVSESSNDALYLQEDSGEKNIEIEEKIPSEQEKHGEKKDYIRFIEEEKKYNDFAHKALPLWLFIILIFIPLGLTSGLALPAPVRSYLLLLLGKRLESRSHQKFTQELNEIIASGNAKQLYNFFMRFLAFILEHDEKSLNEDIVATMLKKRKLHSQKIQEFLDYLNECASLSFSSSQDSSLEPHLLKKAQYWFLVLNR